jgi:hypothetical protein
LQKKIIGSEAKFRLDKQIFLFFQNVKYTERNVQANLSYTLVLRGQMNLSKSFQANMDVNKKDIYSAMA